MNNIQVLPFFSPLINCLQIFPPELLVTRANTEQLVGNICFLLLWAVVRRAGHSDGWGNSSWHVSSGDTWWFPELCIYFLSHAMADAEKAVCLLLLLVIYKLLPPQVLTNIGAWQRSGLRMNYVMKNICRYLCYWRGTVHHFPSFFWSFAVKK